MAKIAFISLYDQAAYGLRMLSACLKKAGHERHIIFLKRYANGRRTARVKLYEGETPWQGIDHLGNAFVYAVSNDITDVEKTLLIDVLGSLKADLIGMTVNSPLKQRAIAVTALVKAKFPDTPVIWGGFEPTINPEESLRYCDIACRGEAERTLVELADAVAAGAPFGNIRNLCVKENGVARRNELYPPEKDLDGLPFQDCDPAGNFLIDGDEVHERPASLSQIKGFYSTISGRGCIYQCSYCCERYLKDLYRPHSFLRRRSPQNMVDELEAVKRQHTIRHVIFQDEVFSHQMDWLEEFIPLYKERVGLPFTGYVVPSADFEPKLRLLKEGGLARTCLAVQTGSQPISKFYKRAFDKELTIKAADVMRAMDISHYVDVITYNPEERKEDLELTLDVLLRFPRPYDICVNKLYVTAGTELAGWFKGAQPEIADKRMFDYYASLFWLSSYFTCSRQIVHAIESLPFFGSHPFALKPILYVAWLARFADRVRRKLKRMAKAAIGRR
jgi:radical SAM superfamily enzyme YgiQ (UPF0313 family)